MDVGEDQQPPSTKKAKPDSAPDPAAYWSTLGGGSGGSMSDIPGLGASSSAMSIPGLDPEPKATEASAAPGAELPGIKADEEDEEEEEGTAGAWAPVGLRWCWSGYGILIWQRCAAVAPVLEEDPEEEAKEVLASALVKAENDLKEALKERIKNKADMFDQMLEDDKKIRLHEPGWKERYYSEKLGATGDNMHLVQRKLAVAFVEGLLWVMKYYYEGVASWTW